MVPIALLLSEEKQTVWVCRFTTTELQVIVHVFDELQFRWETWWDEPWNSQLFHLFEQFAVNFKITIEVFFEIWAKLTRIKSWMRFDSPLLASTKSLVTGPGIPSVYPSPLPTSVSAPLCDSSVCSVPLLPLTSWNCRHNLLKCGWLNENSCGERLQRGRFNPGAWTLCLLRHRQWS